MSVMWFRQGMAWIRLCLARELLVDGELSRYSYTNAQFSLSLDSMVFADRKQGRQFHVIDRSTNVSLLLFVTSYKVRGQCPCLNQG
jgi:hypothetical protein